MSTFFFVVLPCFLVGFVAGWICKAKQVEMLESMGHRMAQKAMELMVKGGLSSEVIKQAEARVRDTQARKANEESDKATA